MIEKSIDEVIKELNSSIIGLDDKEAENRLKKGKNVLQKDKKINFFLSFLKQLIDPLVYVLLAWPVSKWDGEADSGEDTMGQSPLSCSRWHSVAFVADRHPHLLCSNLKGNVFEQSGVVSKEKGRGRSLKSTL